MQLKYAILSILISCMLCACANRQQDPDTINTTNLYELENARFDPNTPSATRASHGALRYKALQDSALSLGAQGGLAYASRAINKRLLKDRAYLDNIFNFNAMVLSHGIMPPVLVEGDHSLNLADPDTIRVADKTYKIIEQARFATTPPNWREYLWLTYTKPEMLHRSLLPRNEEEQKVWRRAIREGWQKGIEQSYSIFHQNLARLKRDYYGMVLYRKLLQQKMINPPFVARTELGITGDGNDMRINDQVLRIVDHPKLQTNSNHWRAVVVKKGDCCG